jgi:hypothetical protein
MKFSLRKLALALVLAISATAFADVSSVALAGAAKGTIQDCTNLNVYVRGDMNGWKESADYKLTYDGLNNNNEAVYSITLKSLDGNFKIADSDYKVINYGTGGDIKVGGQNIYFNGGDCKASGLKNVTLTLYVKGYQANSWLNVSVSEDKEEETPVTTGYTVYFQNTSKWAKVNAHVWDDNNLYLNGEWPGNELSAVTINGSTYYKYSYKGSLSNPKIIFSNNGSNQTNNLDLVDTYVYTPSGRTSQTIVEEDNNGGEDNKEEETKDVEFYLSGEVNEWGIVDAYKFTKGENNTYTLSLDALDGQFKIRDNDANWKGVNFGGDTGGKEVEYIDVVIGDNTLSKGSSVNLKVSNLTNVTLSFTYEGTPSSITLNIKADEKEEEKPVVSSDFYLIGEMTGGFDADVKADYKFTKGENNDYSLKLDELDGQFYIVNADKSILLGGDGKYIYTVVDAVIGENTLYKGSTVYLKADKLTNATLSFTYDGETNPVILTITAEVKKEEVKAADLYIAGQFQDWKPINATKLSPVDNKYSLDIKGAKKAEGFKISTTCGVNEATDWDEFDAGVLGLSDEKSDVVPGTEYKLIAGKKGSLNFTEAGDYTLNITFADGTYTLSIVKTADGEEEVVEAKALYAVGTFNDNPEKATEFTYADGLYTLEIKGAKSGDWFKISTVKGTWDGDDSFNSGVLGVVGYGETHTITVDQTITLEANKSGDFAFPAAGDYKLTVNLDKMTLLVEKTADGEEEGGDENTDAPEVYIRGTFNEWKPDAEYKMAVASEKNSNNEYVYTITLSNMKGCFKIGGADWNTIDYGATGEKATYTYEDSENKTHSAQVLDGNGSGNTYESWFKSDVEFYIDVLGNSATLTFYYNPSKNEKEAQYLRVEGETTGVESVMADQNSDVKYFNLNGVSVKADKLVPGVYIKVANGRAQKVLVK